jgi:ABC-type uncharacterized transport system substrate-binding protein
VERGLRSVLEIRCELRQFNMDTKRRKTLEYKLRISAQARALVESWKPDVVIIADDNAAKYVIAPFFKDHAIPLVFSGVNWTAREYGFPYANVTGMVEIAPIQPVLSRVAELVGSDKGAFYLGADTLTERKNIKRFVTGAKELGIKLDHGLVATLADWKQALLKAQNYSFVIMASNSGINDWDHDVAMRITSEYSKQLSTTNHGWMMPYTMFGMTKIPEEQGEWSAQAALAIISGTSPAESLIMANRKWDLWINQGLLRTVGMRLPGKLRAKAKHFK